MLTVIAAITAPKTCDSSRGHLASAVAADQLGDLRAQDAVLQARERVLKRAQVREQRHHPGITEVQSGRGLAVLDGRRHQTLERAGV